MKKDMGMLGVCDVCARGNYIYVRSSALGPVSFAYCEECLSAYHEPLVAIEFTAYTVGKDCHKLLLGQTTIIDGKIITYEEYLNSPAYEEANKKLEKLFLGYDK